jgi:hypothetical protein
MRACVGRRFTVGDGGGEAMPRLWLELLGGASHKMPRGVTGDGDE